MALLANAPERLPEKKKKSKEKEPPVPETRPMLPLSNAGSKPSSRGARQRLMAQREEQLAAQKVGHFIGQLTKCKPIRYDVI